MKLLLGVVWLLLATAAIWFALLVAGTPYALIYVACMAIVIFGENKWQAIRRRWF